jgi:hypothetical protein
VAEENSHQNLPSTQVEAEVVQTLPKALEAMEILEDIMEVAVATLKVQTSTRLDGKFGKQDFPHLLEVLDREEGLQALECHRH